MIANISTIICILNVTDENTNNGILQKGTAISRIDYDDGHHLYKFYCYLSNREDSNDDDENNSETVESEIVQPLKEDNVYLITGKFSATQDGSLHIAVITSLCLPINKEDIPISKPTVHLLGKTQTYAELSEIGYNLPVQVKPYLSKDHFYPFTINFTHPANGRFKNALTKAKKNSTVYTTGILFLANNVLHCEILEFQFVTTTKSDDGGITVPWKLSRDNLSTTASSSKPKSAIEQRIALVRQKNITTTPTQPPAINSELPSRKRKTKLPMTRLVNISKSLIQDNKYDQEEEINVDDQQDNDNHDDDYESENNKNISNRTRNQNKKNKKAKKDK